MNKNRYLTIAAVGVLAALVYLSGCSPREDDAELLPPPPEPIVEAAPIEPYMPASVDDLLADMDDAQIAFNVPEHLNIEESAQIQLLLSLQEEIGALKQAVEEAGRKEGASIKVGDRMEAVLSGPMFDILEITRSLQAVSERERTEWKWEVTPREEGSHNLYLTLSAFLQVEGDTIPRVIKSFEKEITVEVTAGQKVEAFASANWQWLWAVVVVPIAGWLWNFKKKKSA